MNYKTYGLILFGIGAIHSLLGVVMFGQTLWQPIQQGWWHTLGPEALMATLAFWFLMTGLFICLYGLALSKRVGAVSRLESGTLAVASAVGAVGMPASGFWLPLGLALVASARRAKA